MLTKPARSDIGCGPGKFALEFAKTAQYVIGVTLHQNDSSCPGEFIQTTLNVEFVELDWQKVDLAALEWAQKFDLITAIMSPLLIIKKISIK